ncbi:hypothetical protein PV326_003968 [Microctonus aethiopoides]|uniref:Kinesin-like protein n=2 Tax=Microctonus aethiopoides TaxID=144406 RepID=A0AA39C680_9HYME|nr:hypothetical protein PV326_003968 [Microctonus aethiopoides]KAK0158647.1 hypothetical protein PV328_009624 [Microctonus aethiopoides]
MVKNSIRVYARLKPEIDKISTMNYQVHRRRRKHFDEDFLVISAPQKSTEYIDNRPESWNFSFRQIFDVTVGQEDVFINVARPVIISLFDGYNGTVFAYGQTGSGKTYSTTGDLKKFDHCSGILPRTIRNIFEIIKNNSNISYTVELSYLEIYNENGYDLLDQKQRQVTSRLEDLPRVEIHEDELGTLHLKNLGIHRVKNEQEAMDLLFIGETNRITSETPMNPRSSRSHCIFTIILSSKKLNCNNSFNRAKMHLVDLAGSERVYKCAITGTILTEAKYINLSLHYLEQVIVCLGQENTSHIPYRNSLLTAILRDSLGGNCITNMLANLSISAFNLEETISTCRFAQRVALIRNDVKLILKKEMKTEMDLLKVENDELRKRIDELNGQLESQRSAERNVDYYKDLVLQRDKEISLLNSNKTKITEDKIIETDKLKLSEIIEKCIVDIFPDDQYEDGKNYSINNIIKNNYYPLRILYHDTNFDSISLTESHFDRIEVQKELLNNELSLDLQTNSCTTGMSEETFTNTVDTHMNKLISQNKFIKNNVSISPVDHQKSNSDSPKISFRTPRILRQLFGMEKKSLRPLSTPNTSTKIFKSFDDEKLISRDSESELMNLRKFTGDKKINFYKNLIDKKIRQSENKQKPMESHSDKNFIHQLLLTGDPEVDKEIIKLCKAKYLR